MKADHEEDAFNTSIMLAREATQFSANLNSSRDLATAHEEILCSNNSKQFD